MRKMDTLGKNLESNRLSMYSLALNNKFRGLIINC